MTIQITPVRLGIVVAAIALVAGPFMTAPEYSSLKHSISELGAQATQNAWLMNLGFFCFGVGTALDAARAFRYSPVGSIAFVAFGLSMVLTGVFSHRPIDPYTEYSVLQDQLHTVFSAAVGTGFAVGTLAFGFAASRRSARFACFSATACAVAIPIAMNAFPDVAGILQRLMFAISFVWLWMMLPQSARFA